jgi:hypothetical protein
VTGFTTRTLKEAPPPDIKAVGKAAEQIEIARRALLKAAHHLDASSTRHLHRDVLEQKELADRTSIRLTEFAGE